MAESNTARHRQVFMTLMAAGGKPSRLSSAKLVGSGLGGGCFRPWVTGSVSLTSGGGPDLCGVCRGGGRGGGGTEGALVFSAAPTIRTISIARLTTYN